ncbi:hypothetical protein Ari01nite_94230 [Paractinoplanes rishiriensis]|uniref:Uncharacterized protein n=1 Tax=Paractinoplanes rishiriensis TaxID=1050105 RepID=A0A919KB96_9ACTN|nr:hypothetical protein Ari01nite_94230 [Actinoplanes rishiriensis]
MLAAPAPAKSRVGPGNLLRWQQRGEPVRITPLVGVVRREPRTAGGGEHHRVAEYRPWLRSRSNRTSRGSSRWASSGHGGRVTVVDYHHGEVAVRPRQQRAAAR